MIQNAKPKQPYTETHQRTQVSTTLTPAQKRVLHRAARAAGATTHTWQRRAFQLLVESQGLLWPDADIVKHYQPHTLVETMGNNKLEED